MFWDSRLVGGSCLCLKQQNKHSLLQSTCWQVCSATVVLKTTPQRCCAGSPSVLLSSFAGVKSFNHFLPMAWDDHEWGLRNDDSEGQGDPRSALQPLENNRASLLAFCIYAVVELRQSCCVWLTYGLQWLRAVLITPALSLLEKKPCTTQECWS